jgi:hypothetical protein
MASEKTIPIHVAEILRMFSPSVLIVFVDYEKAFSRLE